MAARQREWAKKASRKLRQQLGKCCAWCGETVSLQFDCIKPMGPRHHKMEWSWRISFYRAQYVKGNLQLLCDSCNASKGDCTCVAGPF